MRLLFAAAIFAISLTASAQSNFSGQINAKAALLVDANTGKVLYKKNDTVQRPVASTQKLLTALIVAESGNLDKPVTITLSDTQCEPFKLYVKPGQTYTRRQLLHALLIRSSNDVARALARDNAGSQEAFARKMNQRMRELGGMSSNFINPNGLPASGQYSTARDMARVARMAYRHPALRQIMRTPLYNFRFSDGRVVPLRNTNRLLRTYTFCNGMKTGYTNLAGHCLISSGTANGRDVIAVVLGSTKGVVAQESAKLLAHGLRLTPTAVNQMRIASN
ncbi:MAG: D-alanyl-D-alanine carboxypeptidase [Verrucomicrobia bacterium]|nr:D-alanyl-D-alanine carboxypeptidase [Verrucomicrobiota bacterium]